MKKRLFNVLMAMLVAVLLAGCSGGDSVGRADTGAEAAKPAATAKSAPAPTVEKGKYYNLEVADMPTYIEQGAIVLDVRTPPEIEGPLGKIEGSLHIPMNQLPNRVGELDKNRGYIVVCRSGNRSRQASKFLADNGFQYIYNLKGGMKAYRALYN